MRYEDLAADFIAAGQALANYRPSFAQAVEVFTVGTAFACDEDGLLCVYRRTADFPFYTLIHEVPSRSLVESKASTADLGSTEEGKGVDLLGDVVSSDIPCAVPLRTILLDAQVSRILSGAGDGDQDPAAVNAETAKFQAIADTGRSFSVPTPNVTYRVGTINLLRGQLVEGDGAHNPNGKHQFTGDGNGPVFQLGDGTSDGSRGNTLRDISIANSDADCINLNFAPDFLIDRVLAHATGGSAVKGLLSVRGNIHNSRLTSSGVGQTAIDLLGYFNGLVMTGCTLSGGLGGRAMRLGLCQGATLDGLLIEVSQDGLWIASTNDADDGQCSGIVLKNFYVEQSKTPLVIGKHFTVQGLDAGGIFISNNLTSGIADREACIQFGRLRSASIKGITLYPHTTEDLFWIWAEHAIPGFGDIQIQPPNVNGSYNAPFAWKGARRGSASVRSYIGQFADFGFMGGLNRIGSSEPREWTSPMIDTSADTGTLAWLSSDLLSAGGRVVGIEITDYDGESLAGVRLQIGRTEAVGEIVDIVDMSTLSFVRGRATLPFTTANIFDHQDAVYLVKASSAAAGKFRLKIRYRAN